MSSLIDGNFLSSMKNLFSSSVSILKCLISLSCFTEIENVFSPFWLPLMRYE
uniref:Uncharacterized protein n=1 Tax=Amphimedon queenslandica TaxID=400682 RepID=A0A1X7UKW0_AMPQE